MGWKHLYAAVTDLWGQWGGWEDEGTYAVGGPQLDTIAPYWGPAGTTVRVNGLRLGTTTGTLLLNGVR